MLRTVPGYEGAADLNAVKEDAKNVTVGILGLGARRVDITKFKDCTFAELDNLLKDLAREIRKNWERGRERTFIFIYYAGHGELEGLTYAVLNDAKKRRFPIEMVIRTLGTNEGAYVVAILDCCRSKCNPAIKRGKDDEGDVPGELDESGVYRNTFVTFGCPPYSGVDERSTIAVMYFAKLK